MSSTSVSLEFIPDPQVIARAAKSTGKAPEEAVLLNTFLLLPVRWRVGAVDLLDIRAIVPGQRGPTIELPLFHVDRVARAAINEATQRGSSTYKLPGSGEEIRLRRIDADVEATSPFTGESAMAPAREFFTAFSAFHGAMGDLVRRELPYLSEHPWLEEPERWSA